MLIVDYKAGQLANRIFQFAYFIAHANEYHYRLINPCFEEYLHLFEATDKNSFPSGRISTVYHGHKTAASFFQRGVNVLRRRSKKGNGKISIFNFHSIRDTHDKKYTEFDMNDPEFVKLVKRQVVFAKGWNYRNTGLLRKHAAALRAIFKPKEVYLQEVVKCIEEAKQQFDVVVGVHLRRGDYKDFFDGRWYYEDTVFAAKLEETRKIFAAKNKTCGFIVCSNEQVNKEAYRGIALLTAERPPVVDLYLLAACDYIIGPPSTFTMWASFYGNTPLYVIRDKEKIPGLSDFKVAEGVESFF